MLIYMSYWSTIDWCRMSEICSISDKFSFLQLLYYKTLQWEGFEPMRLETRWRWNANNLVERLKCALQSDGKASAEKVQLAMMSTFLCHRDNIQWKFFFPSCNKVFCRCRVKTLRRCSIYDCPWREEGAEAGLGCEKLWFNIKYTQTC